MENEIKNLKDRIHVLENIVKYKNEQLDRLSQCNMNNLQALGYMLLACKRAGLSREMANKIYREMYYMFDMKTEKEAEEQGLRCYDENN